MEKIPIAVYERLIGKGDFRSDAANKLFKNVVLTVQGLADSIALGQAFSAQFDNGRRASENFLSCGFLALDFDDGWTVAEAMADQFIRKYAAIIYTTASHQQEKNGKPACDRFRVVFILEKPIQNAEGYRAAMRGLFQKYPQADKSAGDPGRLFCGSPGCKVEVLTDA